jgi:hypothetical protein
MYLMLQFAHAFIISGMHNKGNIFECTAFIMYSASTTEKPHVEQKYLEWCKGSNAFTASWTSA